MTKKQYDLLMTECDAIAAKLKLFPSHVQAEVFRAIYETLTDRVMVGTDGVGDVSHLHRQVQTSGKSEMAGAAVNADGEDWNEAEALSSLADEHGLREIDGVEFAVVVVYFYTVLAPSRHRVASVTLEQFEEACLTVGHSVGNHLAALNNAKRRGKKYLQGGKRDGYSLTGHGKNYVKNTLLKQSNS